MALRTLTPIPDVHFAKLVKPNGPGGSMVVTLIAECSAFGPLREGGVHKYVKPLYDDACDVGIAVHSKRLGEVVYFYESEPQYHGTGADRELAYQVFKPIPEHILKHPGLANVVIHILND